MRCLEALGRWQELEEIGEQTLSQSSHTLVGGNFSNCDDGFNLKSPMNTSLSEAERRQKIIQLTAQSCWAMGNFFLLIC